MRPFFDSLPETELSYIDGKHRINNDEYALSLVRQEQQDHAYLILECIENGERQLKVAHLTYKSDTKKTKAYIIYRDMRPEELDELQRAGFNSYTWKFLPSQKPFFETLMEQQIALGKKGEIDYLLLGKTPASGLIGASLETSRSQCVNEKALKCLYERYPEYNTVDKKDYNKREGLRFLFVSAHNCHSWSEAMVQSLGFPTATSWRKLFIYNSKQEIQGNKDGDAIKPSHCMIL